MSPSSASAPAPAALKGCYAVVSLGCPKALVDSERMLGRLRVEGYRLVEAPEGADFVVVNTCGFLQSARDESLATIRELVDHKRRGRLRGVIVAGCLVERDRETLFEACPGIDQIVGVHGSEEIARAADRLMGGVAEQRTLFRPAASSPPDDRRRLRLTPRHVAYLKISEGCDRLCTFCSIPRMRGGHVSKPIEQVVAEAEALAAEGARELVVIAQDATYYGIDLYGRPRLADLVERLERLEGVAWIRLMYLYPQHLTDALVDRIAASPKVLPYLDVPLQHIDDAVLRRMKRRVTAAETEALVERLRARIPDLVLRTTLIAGFPGETEAQFERLVEFVEGVRFERLGAFAYSFEPDTPSARLDGHLPEEVRQARRDRLLAAQQPIAFAFSQAQVGRTIDVLLDGEIAGEKEAYVGRGYADAPEVDGVVYVTGRRLRPGQIVSCEIVAAAGYDWIAAAVGAPR